MNIHLHTWIGLLLSIDKLLLLANGLVVIDSVCLGVTMERSVWLHFWQKVGLLVWGNCMGHGHRNRLLNFHSLQMTSISSWHISLILLLHHLHLTTASMYHFLALADVLLEGAWAQSE